MLPIRIGVGPLRAERNSMSRILSGVNHPIDAAPTKTSPRKLGTDRTMS